jgi:hypothetical protein
MTGVVSVVAPVAALRRASWVGPIACAIVVGVLHVYPDVRFRAELGRAYFDVPLMGATDEGLYLSRVKRASLGDWRLGNVTIYEHRDDPWIYGPIGEVIEGRLVKWSRLPVGDVDLLLTSILPALLTVIAYGLFIALTGSRSFSSLGAMTIALGQYLLSKDTPLLSGRLVHADWTLPLQHVRPISPQFYFVLFLLILLSAYRVFGEGSRRWAAVCGIALAMLLYTNFYLTSFVVTGLGLLALLAVAQRRFDVAKGFLITSVVAVAGGVPYFHNLWLTTTHPNYQETFARLGGYATRAPILPAAHVAVAAAFVAIAWTARRERWYQFVVAFLTAGFICLNQQILTGRTLQPFHWESQTNKALLEIAIVVAVWFVVRGAASRVVLFAGRVVCATVIAVILAHGWTTQSRYLDSRRDEFVALQPLGAPLRWLAEHTSPTDVVLVNPLRFEWADYVTTISGNYTYISEPFFFASFLSRDEVERRYLGALRFYGASSEEVRGFLGWFNGAHLLGMQGVPWQVPTADLAAVTRYLDDLQRRYDRGHERTAWESVSDFKLDYVLMRADEKDRLIRRIPRSDIDQVYDDGRFAIWRVPPHVRR